MKSNPFRWGILSFIGIIILILDSNTAVNGAREGIELCIRSLIPSLFPFLILTSMMTGSLLGTKLTILKLPAKIMGIPENCESLMIPIFLGGYPAGAQCVSQAYQQKSLSKPNAMRMLLFCNNPGPAFIFGILAPYFPKQYLLWALWGVEISAALICAWILPLHDTDQSSILSAEQSLTDTFRNVLQIMASVCGWVVLFRVMIAFGERWFLWMMPSPLQVILMGILELSNGCSAISLLSDIRLRFVVCAGLLSFGGLCVTMQTASIVKCFSIRPYIVSKLLQSLLCTAVSAMFAYKKTWIFPLIIFVSICLKKTVEFKSTLLYNEDINLRRTPYAVSKENRTRLRILPIRRTVG